MGVMPTPSHPNRVYTTLPPETVDLLEAIAERDDRSVSYLVRRAIDEFLARSVADDE